MNNKYEQLVEYIINDETDKARELFHQIVVEKSRDIYEGLVSDEDLDEMMHGNEVEELVDEVTYDEEGLSEEEDEEMNFDSEMDSEEGEGEEDEDGMEGDEDLEDRVMDLESALDELKAEFDALMADEENEPEHHDGVEDPNFGGEEEAAPEEFFEDDDSDNDDDEDEEVDESIVREYVEKVAAPGNSEGAAVGTGKSVSVNTKSSVAGKNPMDAGAASGKNLAQGGVEKINDGTHPDASRKPKQGMPHADKFQNVPGASAGKTAFKTKEAAKGSEGTAVGHGKSVSVNDTSVIKTTPR